MLFLVETWLNVLIDRLIEVKAKENIGFKEVFTATAAYFRRTALFKHAIIVVYSLFLLLLFRVGILFLGSAEGVDAAIFFFLFFFVPDLYVSVLRFVRVLLYCGFHLLLGYSRGNGLVYYYYGFRLDYKELLSGKLQELLVGGMS